MDPLDPILQRLAALGANLTVDAPGRAPTRIGPRPEVARVVFRTPESLEPLLRGDHLALAEAHLRGEIDLEGDLLEVMKVTEHLALDAGPLDRLRYAVRLFVGNRVRWDRESIAFHYDRPAEFFLPWLDRWRCYSHGIYLREDEPLEEAVERKMERAAAALGLEPGMDVLDMGGGWGCFVEWAGQRGIRVHSITISEAQHRFVENLIREQGLPCTSQLVNFREYRPALRFHAAVFMGTFEHNPEYGRAARFLTRHLLPGGRIWADFCANRSDFQFGAFMRRHIWPGAITYVNPHGLAAALIREGFNVHEMVDDTLSYACTIRDWGDRFDASAKSLAERFGEPTVRAFRLFLRGSWYFLRTNRTQAYHVVAGLEPAPLGASQTGAAFARPGFTRSDFGGPGQAR